jgi:hypothetical protein
MADLVRDHAGELVLVAGDGEDAGVEADLAARQRECIGFVVDEQRALPPALPCRRQFAGDRADHATHGVGQARIIALLLLRLELRERLRAELIELFLRDRTDRPGGARSATWWSRRRTPRRRWRGRAAMA